MSVTKDRQDTIADHLQRCGVSRRDFIGFCSKLMVTAPFGLAITNFLSVDAVAAEIGAAKRPSVIWLHMQDCTGCTETLLRPSQIDLATLILDLISLDYHETVMAPSGADAERALHDAMEHNAGKYVLVVEGSIPLAENGQYLKIGGKWGVDFLKEVSANAAAIISIGSCSAWGGVPSAGPNPTGAVGVDAIIKDKPIVNIPGCPPNPYILLGTVLQYAKTGTLPELDDKKRPKFAFDRVIHEHCPRRPHFDAGRFASIFGDEGHRQGYCLYKLGCKGPVTHASCSTRHFNEIVDAWPIGVGAPCFGCTEQFVGYTLPAFQTVPIKNATPPSTYPGVGVPQGYIGAAATGAAGLAGGVLLGAGYVAARRFSGKSGDESVPGSESEGEKK